MIKCNVTVCGTIGRDAATRTGKEEKTFLSFPLRVAIQSKDGQSETVEIGVSRDGGPEEAAGYRSLIQDYGLTQEEAAAKVAISAADNVVTITLGFDVNMTGKVDVNDAQLVYDMYNGTYSDFTKVSVEKFLRADVNATKAVDHTDAVAIVNQFK